MEEDREELTRARVPGSATSRPAGLTQAPPPTPKVQSLKQNDSQSCCRFRRELNRLALKFVCVSRDSDACLQEAEHRGPTCSAGFSQGTAGPLPREGFLHPAAWLCTPWASVPSSWAWCGVMVITADQSVLGGSRGRGRDSGDTRFQTIIRSHDEALGRLGAGSGVGGPGGLPGRGCIFS